MIKVTILLKKKQPQTKKQSPNNQKAWQNKPAKTTKLTKYESNV